MFLYWPAILIGLTVLILFFPAPILYHRSREWWAYSNVRIQATSEYCITNVASSFDYCLLGCIPWSSETFFLVICTARRHMPWE